MNLLGHGKQKEILKKIAESNNLPHSMLFVGPEGVGKKKAAVEFVKTLNCKKGNACGDCPTCKEIEKGNFSDFFLIEEDDEITIDKVRELQKRFSLTGRRDGCKGAIIDKAHLLNPQAQASLLKTLEEPKGRGVIILVSEHPKMLLDTILSRVWELKFSPVDKELIIEDLQKRGASKKEADDLASLSSSRPGLAIKLFEEDDFRKRWKEKEEDLQKLQSLPLSKRFDYVKKMSEDSVQARETLKIWISALRKEMISSKDRKRVSDIRINLEEMEEILLITSKTNVNLKLALEKIIINI